MPSAGRPHLAAASTASHMRFSRCRTNQHQTDLNWRGFWHTEKRSRWAASCCTCNMCNSHVQSCHVCLETHHAVFEAHQQECILENNYQSGWLAAVPKWQAQNPLRALQLDHDRPMSMIHVDAQCPRSPFRFRRSASGASLARKAMTFSSFRIRA